MRLTGSALSGAALLLAAMMPAMGPAAADALPPPVAHAISLAPPQLFPICRPLPAQAEVPASLSAWAQGAQLFPGLGRTHRAADTASPAAQTYFDQGLAWLYAYNHDEATRSFARAAAIDPDCAMCFWGVALSIGPNYNLPLMTQSRGRVAYAALRQAIALAPKAPPVAQALITALQARYPSDAPIGDQNYDRVQQDYARAMRQVADRFSEDDDVQVLTAEAEMGVHAWKLWQIDGTPNDGTADIVARLERVIARNKNHAGANHYYVHAMEASPHPERAEAAADRLAALMPGAGHIVHMPSHIYQRIGRYRDVAAVNDRAARTDLAYFARTAPLDYYGGYTAHNWDFEAFGAVELGRKAQTLAALRHAGALMSDAQLVKLGGDGWMLGRSYIYLVRFADWPALLASTDPGTALPARRLAWVWARGYALAATGKPDQAQAAAAAITAALAAAHKDDTLGLNATRDIYHLAQLTLDAAIAQARHDRTSAIALLRQAVAVEDGLAYDEPADWVFPVRLVLGGALLQAQQPAEAAAVYREDLRRRPHNGWALHGLAQALAAQGDAAAARTASRQFAAAWAGADSAPNAPWF